MSSAACFLAANSPENDLVQVDIWIAVSSVHQERVLDIPPSLPEALGVALNLAILHTKLHIDFVLGSNIFENGVCK